MSDRRFRRANDHVAHVSVEGEINAPRVTKGELERCALPVANLLSAPDGPRDKQILFGLGFQVLERRGGWAFGFDPADGYTGYLLDNTTEAGPPTTHKVTALSTHIYQDPDIKSRDLGTLPFGAELSVVAEEGGFHRLAGGGFVPNQHLAPLSWRADHAASIAELFLGVPYLWGGNSAFGIDCSGLVQTALWAVGRACPRDSDLQAKIGTDITDPEDLRRGDLVLWRGHVGMMLDRTRLIHANAHHMAVAIEPLSEAVSRIAAREFGEVTGLRRV